MKAVFQLEKLMRCELLLIKPLKQSVKQIQVDKSGFWWLNVFVQMEWQFLLLSYLVGKIYHLLGFQQIFMKTGDSPEIHKDG